MGDANGPWEKTLGPQVASRLPGDQDRGLHG